MEIIELYLEGKVEIWYQSLKMVRGRISWGEFADAMVKRFGEKRGIDEIEEFNKLQQVGSVLEYQEHFEELNHCFYAKTPNYQKHISYPALLVASKMS